MSPDSSRDKLPYAVIGGGFVGLCCAIHLRRAGQDVVLIDPGDMKRAASYGNSGQFAIGEVIPLSVPGVLFSVPRWLLDPLGPLAIRWRNLPELTPWLLKFLKASRRERMEEVAAALTQLCELIHFDYEPLIKAAGAEDTITNTECIRLFVSREEFDEEERKFGDLRIKGGGVYDLLDADALHAEEPEIDRRFTYGAIMKGRNFVSNLPKLLRAFAALLQREGGTMIKGEVVDFERSDRRVDAVRLADGARIAVRGVVVAAGAWSRTLCRRLGDKVPLESERGYHVMLPNSGVKLRRSLTIPSRGFGIVPMQAGLCIAGTVELARLGAPPNYARADRLVEKARAIFPHLNAEGATQWMGNRPAMPDSIPVIDRAGKVENAFYAFGHGHRGMSFAATTGRLIAGLVTNQKVNFDLGPYNLNRF